MTGGTMEERQLHPGLLGAWTFVEEVRQELLAAIRGLGPTQWVFRPSTKTWCIGEVVEHLLLSDVGSSKMVRKLIRGDYRNIPYPEGTRLWGVHLDRYPFGLLDAPRALAPGSPRDRTIVESELGMAHDRLRLELTQFQDDDPEALRSPDPATGEWFTLGGWVKLHAWHEKHHVEHIQRLMATAGLR